MEDFSSEVILALAFPPSILLLDVKSSSAWPMHVDAGHQQHYAGSSDSSDEEIEVGRDDEEQKLGRQSGSSTASLHITSLFRSRKHTSKKPSLFSMDGSKQATDLVETGNLITRGSTRGGSLMPVGSSTRWTSKVGVFYLAPITTFWAWSLSFASFLFAMTYVLLIEFPVKPLKVEWFLLAYVIAFAMEHFRKLIVQEASSLLEKIRVFFNRHWNYLTVLAILSFFVGFAFRLNPTTRHSYGRVILACDSVLWYIKVLDFMSVHPRLGPYITMAGKMILNMCYILVLLLVTLMAFGVSRQSITYPHEKWNWLLVRNIFYKPYFMLYGEVYAGEIDTCGDEGTNCVPGGWIPPALMTVFLLVANILLINMLIAIFNNIFNETNDMSQQVWLFQRYEQVLEYENTPLLPPPFTPIAHLISLMKHLLRLRRWDRRRYKRGQGNYGSPDFAMKVRLDEDEIRKLHDFEEDCMDDLSRKKLISEALNSETRLQNTAERAEIMYSRLNEMMNEEWNLKSAVWEIESRLENIEKNQRDIIAILKARSTMGTDVDAVRIDQKRSQFTSRHTTKRQRAASMVCGDTTEDDLEANGYESPASLPEKQTSFPRRRYIRRNEAYTSITDAIKLLSPVPTDAEANFETPSAKPSFVLRQNEMLRNYEEASSLITSEIIAGRRRRDSSTWSACEDMHEMDKATGRVGSESSSSGESSDSPRHRISDKLGRC
uniref:Transient receptor potential channel n=1 Tax=Ascaris suum TaxID=6253 RepID=F1KTF4_ASCSU